MAAPTRLAQHVGIYSMNGNMSPAPISHQTQMRCQRSVQRSQAPLKPSPTVLNRASRDQWPPRRVLSNLRSLPAQPPGQLPQQSEANSVLFLHQMWPRRPFLSAQAALLVASASATGITNDSSVAVGQTFDYIVVGGGTAGTAVAVRLAEDPALKILVIEVGADARTDPDVFDIYRFTDAYGGPLDWAWPTDQNKTIHGYVSLLRASVLASGS